MTPEKRLDDALRATVAAGTARVRLTPRRGQAAGPIADPARELVGVVDLDARRAVLRSAEGYARIFDGGREFSRPDGEGDWIPVGAATAAAPVSTQSPLWMFNALTSPRNDVVETGLAEHRGESVACLTATIEAKTEAPQYLQLLFAAFATAMGKKARKKEYSRRVEATIWLDTDGRVRLLGAAATPPPADVSLPDDIAATVASVTGTPEQPMWTTTELWDFGVAADIALPDPASVGPVPGTTPTGEVEPELMQAMEERMQEAREHLPPEDKH